MNQSYWEARINTSLVHIYIPLIYVLVVFLLVTQKNKADKYVVPIIYLLVSVVRQSKDQVYCTNYISAIYDVMSSLFVDVANRSQVGTRFFCKTTSLAHP